MAKRSAGILLHRIANGSLEVLLVHPGGPFWRNRDFGAWQIPKGMVEAGEDDESTARRELAEELGVVLDATLAPLGEVRQSGGKVVVAFSAERDVDPKAIVSNTIEMAWPPRSGKTIIIPEVDEARWFGLDEARRYMLPSQAPLIERLAQTFRTHDPFGGQDEQAQH